MTPHRMRLAALTCLAISSGCARNETGFADLIPLGAERPPTQPIPAPAIGSTRLDGRVGTTATPAQPQISLASPVSLQPGAAAGPAGPGDIALDFADTDIREVVAQILGTTLRLNYTIDPSIRGTVTLRTAVPLQRSQLIPVLQTLLAQNNASLVQAGGLYRVLPTAAAGSAGGLATGAAEAGSSVVALRFASAEELAKVLQPFVANGGRILADPTHNAMVVSGDPGTRQTLLGLIAAFDIDTLAGQSYALFPVAAGDAKDFAQALQEGFAGKSGLSGVVRVVPMQRLNAVLVVAAQPRVIEDVRRVYALVDRARRQTVRVWHVFYLQNSRSNDIAHVLQQAFTPRSVTAQPTPTTAGRQGRQPSNGPTGTSGSGVGGALRSGGSNGLAAGVVTQQAPQDPASAQPGAQPGAQAQSNPLLGGLDPTEAAGDTDTMRIIPNPQNNAVLVYGTAQELDTVEATLRKLDILPLQVRIDATIAEVTLNDSLKFGTQFFFRGGGLAGALGGTLTATGTGVAAQAISSAAGNFVFGSADGSSALTALQAVTTVKVLSSPQLLVLDNESARLQVGNIVPFLTQSSQSTLTSGSPVINSIDYRETGVIMEVTPRVNSGGLVTLDISQEVSDVDPAGPTTSGINSPTFQERAVRSRVVIQDGQTVGLAGLIRDSDSRGNSGIPWLKDVPILGLLAGQQSNARVRTELLVLITPHVVHDQRDARALTEDLRDQLNAAASVPGQLRYTRPSGSNDPSLRLRRGVGLEP